MDNKRENRIISKFFLSLMPAQAIAVGLPAINSLIDSFIIGNFLGETALAALGFTSPLTQVVSLVSSVVSMGTQTVLCKALGRGDRDGMKRIFASSVVLCVMLSVLFSLVMLVLAAPLASLLGATGLDIGASTAELIRGLACGCPFTVLLSVLTVFLQTERMDKVITVSSVVTVLVNVGGNLANALWLHLGTFGIGLFLSLGTVCAVIIDFVALLMRKNIYSLSPKYMNLSAMKDCVLQGNSAGVIWVASIVRTYTVNYFTYAVCGTLGMAAMSVAGNVSLATVQMVEAGALGAGRLAAGILSESRDTDTLRGLHKIMARATWMLYIAVYLPVVLLADPIARLLGAGGGDVGTYALAVILFNLYTVTEVFLVSPVAVYQGLGKSAPVNIVYLFNSIVLGPLVFFLFTKPLGIVMPAISPMFFNTVNYLGFAVYFIVKARRMPHSPFNMIYLPSTPNAPKEARFSATVSTVEDATEASERVRRFCLERGMDERRAYFCALCIEEIAVDTVTYRFQKDKSTLDVRVVCENGKAFIMLRDDCERFDINEWLRLCAPEDTARSLGIRAVSRLADEMKYVNTLGLNVLTVTV